MPKTLDITGIRFGFLVALKYIQKKRNLIYWLFRCDCGIEKIIRKTNVTSGITRSCGHLALETRIKKDHGMTGSRFHRIWLSLFQRCYNPIDRGYKNYGGRGIIVSLLWFDFKEFKKDMYQSYLIHVKEFGEKNTSLDRLNNNGIYIKNNCRWATKKEQSRNTRMNHYLTHNGQTLTISEWSEITGIKRNTIYERINRFKWSIEDSLNK